MNLRISTRHTTALLACTAVALGLLGVTPAGAAPRRLTDPPGTQLLTPGGGAFPDLPQLWTVTPTGVVFTDSTGTWLQPSGGGAAQEVSGPGSSITGAAGPMLWVVDGTGLTSWFNTGTGASGNVSAAWKVPSPVGGLYMLLSPRNSIHVMNHNVVSDKLTDLGAVGPWSSSTDAMVPGPNGVLVVGAKATGAVGMMYLSYAGKKISPNVTGIPANHIIKCVSVSATGAGCVDKTTNTVIGISFSGAAPTMVAQPGPIGSGPVVTSTTLAWTMPGTDDVLHTVPVRGGTESVLSAPTLAAGRGLLTDGTNVIMPTAGDTDGDIGSISSVGDATGTPVSMRDDPTMSVQASQIAIGPGRVAWADNANRWEPLWTRTDGPGGDIALGQRTNVANGLTANGLFVSGRYTAYDNDNGYPVLTDGTTPTVMTQPGSVVGLSGNRMLYMRSAGYHPTLYDMVTKKATDLKVTYPSMTTSSPVALYGNYVLFFQDNGSVWRADVSTGAAPVQVAPGQGGSSSIVHGAIWAAGNFVAWNVVTFDGSNFRAYNKYVDVTSGNAPSNAPDGNTIIGAGEAGLVLMANNQDSLLSWDGANTMALSGVNAVTDGDRVAWIGLDGAPRIAQVSYPVNSQPWALTAPVAGAGLDRTNSWALSMTTSSPLTNCSVAIVDAGGNAVDTAPCDPTAAAIGEVRVNWTPADSVGFGQYAWRLDAGNASGSLLTATGSPVAPSGPISVGVIVTGAAPASLPHGATNQQVVVSGYHFDNNALVSFTGVVRVLSVVVNSPTQLTAIVNVLSTAGPSPRDITVTDPGSADGVCSRCFAIT